MAYSGTLPMTENAQRWRYEDRNGRAIWLAFDPAFLCVYCEQPVGELGYGGPAVCGACDCGCHRDGTPWGQDFYRLAKNANKRFAEMPSDPVWDEYEQTHKEAQARGEQEVKK
jgi:hypothetical protein